MPGAAVDTRREIPLEAFFVAYGKQDRAPGELVEAVEVPILDQPERSVLAHVVRLDDDATLGVHNLSAEPRTVDLRVPGTAPGTRLVDQLCDSVVPLDERGRVELDVDGYGCHWFRVSPPDDRRLA